MVYFYSKCFHTVITKVNTSYKHPQYNPYISLPETSAGNHYSSYNLVSPTQPSLLPSLPRSYPSSAPQWWGIMSEVMANINQVQQSTSRHSCPSVIGLSLPVCGKGGRSPRLPVLPHLVRVDVDQYLTQHARTCRHTFASNNINTAVYALTVWLYMCACVCHPPLGTGRWL